MKFQEAHMHYKTVLSNFAYTAGAREEIERLIAEVTRPHHAQLGRPRISALLDEEHVRVGMKLIKDGMPGEYRNLEFLLFAELVPGYRDAVIEAMDADKDIEDVLTEDQLMTAEGVVICGLALMRALSKDCYPDHMHESVPWREFVATVRRASVMGDLPKFSLDHKTA